VDNNTNFFDETNQYEEYDQEYTSGRNSKKFERGQNNYQSAPKFADFDNT
jgi:hypothetical protein